MPSPNNRNNNNNNLKTLAKIGSVIVVVGVILTYIGGVDAGVKFFKDTLFSKQEQSSKEDKNTMGDNNKVLNNTTNNGVLVQGDNNVTTQAVENKTINQTLPTTDFINLTTATDKNKCITLGNDKNILQLADCNVANKDQQFARCWAVKDQKCMNSHKSFLNICSIYAGTESSTCSPHASQNNVIDSGYCLAEKDGKAIFENCNYNLSEQNKNQITRLIFKQPENITKQTAQLQFLSSQKCLENKNNIVIINDCDINNENQFWNSWKYKTSSLDTPIPYHW